MLTFNTFSTTPTVFRKPSPSNPSPARKQRCRSLRSDGVHHTWGHPSRGNGTKASLIQGKPMVNKPLRRPYLVGGFNPFEKYWSNWESSPNRGENKKCLKPPASYFWASGTLGREIRWPSRDSWGQAVTSKKIPNRKIPPTKSKYERIPFIVQVVFRIWGMFQEYVGSVLRSQCI